MTSELRYSRQIAAFGREGQHALATMKICVVGLGGLGSHIAQGLAYLGARDFSLVDADAVDATSLNRLIGSQPGDVGAAKVDVAARLIRAIAPEARIEALAADVRTRAALESARESRLLVAGVDREAPRLVLTELAAAFKIPLVDVATEIFVEGQRIIAAGGRVVFAQSGRYCLLCADQIDVGVASRELAPKSARAIAQRHGYGLGPAAPAPSVVALNGVLANLALIEILAFVSGWRQPRDHLTYDAMRGVVLARVTSKRADCYVCGDLVGRGDNAGVIERYATAREVA